MTEVSQTEGPRNKRLESWKEIAVHLNRGVRTVQRWEQAEGLPVHRLPHEKRGSVYAYPEELDAWWNTRGSQLSDRVETAPIDEPVPGPPVSPKRSRMPYLFWALFILSTAAALLLWLTHSRSTTGPMAKLVPLTSYPGTEDHAAFSPDGSRIAFSWRPDDGSPVGVYTQVIGASGAPLLLASHAFAPAWAPDGRFVSFLRDNPDGRSVTLFLVPALGGTERRLSALELPKFVWLSPIQVWTPDGKGIVAPDRSVPGQPFALTAFSVETGERRRITHPPPGIIGDTAPAISSDGREFAFIRSDAMAVGDLFAQAMPSETSSILEPKRITRLGWQILDLLRKGDSRELLFTARREGAKRLWRISLDRPGVPVLVDGIGLVGNHLAMSSKGDRLAYCDSQLDPDIWRQDIPETGQAIPPVVSLVSSTRREWNVRISPDGRKLAFASNRTGSYEIWVADSDGNHPAQLTSFDGPLTGTPRWSPDSSQLAFDSVVNGNADIYVVNAGGGKARRLTNESSEDIVPSWSRDGQWVYFISNRSGPNQLWKMSASGGSPAVQITRGGARDALEAVDGKWVYFVKDAEFTSLWRVPPEGGQEEKVLDRVRFGLNFDVTRQGICFVDHLRQGIECVSFDTHEKYLSVPAGKTIYGGISVSPDVKWFAFAALKPNSGDLIMVDRFR